MPTSKITLVVPARAENVDSHLAFAIGDITTGLHLRRGVAVPTNGVGADHTLTMSHETWADIVGAKLSLVDALASDAVTIAGDRNVVTEALACLDHSSFAR